MSINTASTRLLDIGDVLSDTFAVIGRSFIVLANVAVMLIAIPAAIRIAGVALTPVSPIFALLTVIGWLATGVGTLLAYGVIFQIAMQDLHGQAASTDLVFKVALSRLWPLAGMAILLAVGVILASLVLIVPGVILGKLGLGILLGLGMFLGGLLLIIVGVMLGLAWSVAMPALVLENRGVFESFKRSADLTRSKRWSIFLLYFLVVIVTVIMEVVLVAIFGGFHGLRSGQPALAATALSSLLSVVTVPFGAVLSTALFDQLRGREGYGADAVAEVFA